VAYCYTKAFISLSALSCLVPGILNGPKAYTTMQGWYCCLAAFLELCGAVGYIKKDYIFRSRPPGGSQAD